MTQALPPARPVTDDDRNEILVPIVSGLQELIFGSPGLFVDRPGFVAGPTPDTGLARAVQGVTRFNCRIWAGSDKSEYSLTVNQGNAELCGPYLDGLNEKPEDGFAGLPFEGGQCPAVYLVSYTSEQDGVPGPAATVAARGPITGIRGRITETGARIVELGCTGVNLGSSTCIGVANTGAGFYLLAGLGSAGGVPTARITGVSPCGLDNCGDPPPVIQPPATVEPVTPPPPEITIELPGVGPVDITLTLNPNGEPVVCIPELDVCVTVQPPGAGGGGGGSSGPPGPGEPGGPQDTGPGGDAAGEAGDGEELVGVLVAILSSPEDANRFDNNPAQPFRGIGYVRMGFPGRLGTDVSAGTVIGPQFFHAQQRGLTAWEVRANTGFNLRVTPYYRSPE